MKNASVYQKKVKKLIAGAPKARVPEGDPVRVLIEAVLSEDATRKQVQPALDVLEAEFVDYNELRVSPAKEIVERLGSDFPYPRQKAEGLVKALNAVFDKTSTMAMSYMDQIPKRELRRHLREVGLSPFAEAYVSLMVFGVGAIPVDCSLVVCLEAEDAVAPGSSVEEVQAFLERVIPQKDALSAHEAFRRLVERSGKLLAKKRKGAAAAEAAAEAAQQPAGSGERQAPAPRSQAPSATPARAGKAKVGKAAKTAKSARAPKGGARKK